MSKKYTLLILIVIVAGAIFWIYGRYFNIDFENINSVRVGDNRVRLVYSDSSVTEAFDLSLSFYSAVIKLLEPGSVSNNDIEEIPPEVIAIELDKESHSIILFIEIPTLSGTGGAKIIIVRTDFVGNQMRILDDLFASRDVLNETLEVSDGIIKFTELQKQGICCHISREIVINILEPERSLKPPFPDSIDLYLTRNGLSVSLNDLSDSLSDYKWLNENTVEIKRQVYTSTNNNFPVEIWNYDIKNMVYSLES